MNFEFFIAKRLARKQNQTQKKSGTRPIIAIAIGGIIIGVAVMILSMAILTGFQQEIQSKVIGFGGHVQVNLFQSEDGYEQSPVDRRQDFVSDVADLPYIETVSVYANKAGILKQDDAIQGIVIKGVDSTFNWSFFQKHLIEGTIPTYSQKRSDFVLVSSTIANQMKLKVGDRFLVYFIQDNKPRPRKFNIAGIYNTGLADFDNLFILGDIQHVQRLNGWDKTAVGGFEINLSHIDWLTDAEKAIYQRIPYTFKTTTIDQRFPDIFSWLELQDVNVIIIITLVILVSAINMTSALLILILDRTPMIGILKALGSNNWSIRKIFLYQAALLIGVGMFWGNLLGLGLGVIQQQYGLIKLPEASYYLTEVPVNFEWEFLVALNAGTLVLCTVMLILPTYIVTTISPVKAIRFN